MTAFGHGQNYNWDAEGRVDRLKVLWLEGLSASRIAGKMPREEGEFPPSRSAVIGKVHRLKIGGRKQVTYPRPPRQAKPAPTPKGAFNPFVKKPRADKQKGVKTVVDPLSLEEGPPPMEQIRSVKGEKSELRMMLESAPLPAELPPAGPVLNLVELNERTCKWPHGDPKTEEFGFCGMPPVLKGQPYCEFHSRRAYHLISKRA